MGIHTTPRFITDDQIEVPAVTAEQMRELDRVAMEETGPNLFQMMENAGRNLAHHAINQLGSNWKRAHVLVLAGGGGNGGGGICAARHLANRDINVGLMVAEPDRLGEVPRFQRKVFASTRGREIDAGSLGRVPADLIVDALIGYGLRSAPRGRIADLIAWANEISVPIVALDVPSGLNATTGECPGAYVRALTTLTLALPKTGLIGHAIGDLWLADIGLPRAAFSRAGLMYEDPFGAEERVHLTRS